MKKNLQSLMKYTKGLLTSVLLAVVFSTVNAATFTVTTTADAGAGSFRQAILDANALAGTDNIIFNIGTGPQTITLLSSVNVTTPMYIDGTTQPGFTGTPLITIGGISMFNINSVNTGTLSSLGFVSNTSSTAINVINSNNWLFINNNATGMSIAFQMQGNNSTNTITANNFSGSVYGIYMNGGTNNGNTINNNNLSNCTTWALNYNFGTPASINTNTFTGSANALYLRGASTFTLGSSNIFKNQTGISIQLDACSAVNVSNNAVNGTGGHGILVNQSNNCVIDGNTTCGRTIGVRIQGSSNANTISNGSIVSCGTGIQLDNSSVNNTTITAVNLFNTTNINNAGANTVITSTTSTNTSPIVSVNSGSICSGSSFTMSPSGALTYTYTGGSAIVSPTTTTSYSVVGIDANGCVSALPAVSNVTVNVCAVAAALNFDGTDDRVNIGNSITSSLSGGTKVSVEAWVKPTNLSGLGCIVGNYQTGAGANLQVLLRRSGNSYYEFWVGNGTSWNQTTSAASPTVNVWQHVAATWNGTVASIYVNGVLSGTTTPGITSMGSAGSGPVWIGGNNISENFTGNIDEVRIWNVVRTQCEINTYKNCEIPTTASGLLANYHFNQGFDGGTNTSATTLTDAAATNTGTLTNMALTGVTSNWVAPGGVVSGYTTPVNSTPTVTVNSGAICAGESFTMMPTGADTYTFSSGSDVVMPTADATYTVSGIVAATGCSNTTVSSVTVNALPVITSQPASVTVCGNATAVFTVIATNGDTYSWGWSGNNTSFVNTTGAYGETGYTTSVLTIPNLESEGWDGYYIRAVVTSSNGCSVNSTSGFITVNALPTISVNSGSICTGQSFTMVPTGASTYTYSNGTDVVTPTSNDSYTVTGTDGNGCENTAVSSVTVNLLPSLMATTNNTLLCTGETSTLSVMGASTYTWSTAENTTDIVVSPTVQTTYTVDGTDANGCTNSTTVTQDVSLCTGITSLVKDASNNVYPNPNNGSFVIELTTLSKVTVTNALGQVIISEMYESGKHDINIQEEKVGIYFVKITNNNKQQIIKVIKQ